MKMRVKMLGLTLVMCISAAVSAYGEENIRMFINEAEISFDQPPVIVDGRTLVPARAVTDAFGAEVTTDFSDNDARYVYIELDGKKFTLQIDSDTVVDETGTETTLDVPATIIGDRTMVPVRFISESFGATVNWNGDERIIEIEYGGQTADNAEVEIVQESLFTPIDAKFDFDKYYESATAEKYKNAADSNISGQLVWFEGIVQSYSKVSGRVNITVADETNKVAATINGGNIDEKFEGKQLKIYGTIVKGGEVPEIMLLRYVDEDGLAAAIKSSGLELALAFEGEPLSKISEIKAFLDEYAGDKSSGVPYFTYKVTKGERCDYTIVVGFNESHEMGNALRFANIADDQRAAVEEELTKRMKMLAIILTEKCPGITLEGYYEDSFKGYNDKDKEVTYRMRHASWVNDTSISGKNENGIVWLTQLDESWYEVE